MNPEWWHWAVGGIVLMLAELALPTFVVFWFGLGALLVALVLLVAPGLDVTAQILLWTLASVAMVALWFKVFKPQYHKTLVGRADAAIGEVGVLVRDVAPFQRGEVRFQRPVLGSDLWECLADEPLRAADRVRVVAIEGSLLKVARAS
jgi:membrane protein implicated in regulation of membrane protease activity